MTRPEHYRFYSAVFPILLREGANGQEVLLHLRQNTGYMDGCWDFAGSGHVDENETARQAVAREPTNQQFPVLPNSVVKGLQAAGYRFEVDHAEGPDQTCIRLVTSWATPEDAVNTFLQSLADCKE